MLSLRLVPSRTTRLIGVVSIIENHRLKKLWITLAEEIMIKAQEDRRNLHRPNIRPRDDAISHLEPSRPFFAAVALHG